MLDVDDNYTKLKENVTKVIKTNVFGTTVRDTIEKTVIYEKRLLKLGGMRMLKYAELSDKLEDVITSNLDFKIVNYLIKNQSKLGFVKGSDNKGVKLANVAKEFNTTPKKISTVITKLVNKCIIKKVGRLLYINPYLILPYANSKKANYILQLQWEDDFKHTIEELLEVHETEITKAVTTYEK